MADSFEKLKKTGGKMLDLAGRSVNKLAEKGKTELDRVAIKRRVAKAERQLGTLVYTLRKTGQTNEPLVGRYMEEIDTARRQLSELEKTNKETILVHSCSSCGAEVSGGAIFCGRCGKKLS